MKRILITILAVFATITASAQYKTVTDIPYRTDSSEAAFRQERCKLDVYYPENAKEPFKTIVWVHGGALMYLQKELPEQLMNRDVAIVAMNYSQYPQGRCPEFIEDVAAAIAWTFAHIAEYGGSADEIYVAGHSTGGYLALMVALDKSYLGAYGIDADAVKGYYSIGGQTAVPDAVCKQFGLAVGEPAQNEFAPLSHIRKLQTPLVLITGDRRLEQPRRYEENTYLKAALETFGNAKIPLYEMQGFTHEEAYQPATLLVYKLVTGKSVSTLGRSYRR